MTCPAPRTRFAARTARAIASVLALAVASPPGGRADSLASRPSEMPMVFVWRIDKQSKEPSPAGSGFLLGADGVVVTAKHVAAHNEYQDLAVSISRKNAPPVPVMKDVDCDQVYDFCLLRILDTDVKDARIDPADFYALACRAVEVEETVLAYGFLPGNNGVSHPDGKTTTGIIDEGLILTTVDLEPSMSGGPVFDKNGKVIAIVNGGATQQSAILPIQRFYTDLINRDYECRNRRANYEINESVSQILTSCYRRALFTRTQHEINQDEMFKGIRECGSTIQNNLLHISDPEQEDIALQLSAIIDNIELIHNKHRHSGLLAGEEIHNIDILKVNALHLFRRLTAMVNLNYPLPDEGSLARSNYFTQKEADAPLSLDDISTQVAIVNVPSLPPECIGLDSVDTCNLAKKILMHSTEP